jgi:hypothetical protein
VGKSDRDDLYRLKLSNRSRLNLRVSGIQRRANLDVELFTLKGNKQAALRQIGRAEFNTIPLRQLRRYITRVGRSTAVNRQAEAFNRVLEAGEYYLRVYQRSGDTRYRLRLAATPELSTPTPAPTPTPTPAPTPAPTPPTPATQPWFRQFRSAGDDNAYSVAVNAAGVVYVAGRTPGTSGRTDSLIARYDTNGDQPQITAANLAESSAGSEVAFDIAVDGNGAYYVAGATNVTPLGSDGFVAKYGSAGNLIWKQYIKTTVSVPLFGSVAAGDAASGIAIAADGSVYVSGLWKAVPGTSNQGNAFIAKYNGATGDLVTTFGNAGFAEFGGAAADAAAKVAIDSTGNVYITGITDATLTTDLDNPFTGGDAFVAKYSSSGVRQWQQTLGSTGSGNAQDYALDLAVDAAGNVYITGQTSGTLPGQSSSGDRDAFVAKYVQSGSSVSLFWLKQFGTAAHDEAQGIAVDGAGNVYLAGETEAALFGDHAGDTDAWFAKYDGAGTLLNSQQVGTSRDDSAYAITIDSAGNLYVVGQTEAALAGTGTHLGGADAWVSRFPPL